MKNHGMLTGQERAAVEEGEAGTTGISRLAADEARLADAVAGVEAEVQSESESESESGSESGSESESESERGSESESGSGSGSDGVEAEVYPT